MARSYKSFDSIDWNKFDAGMAEFSSVIPPTPRGADAVSPTGESLSGSDFLNALKVGYGSAAQGVGWAVEKLGMDDDGSVRNFWAEYTRDKIGEYSNAAQAARQQDMSFDDLGGSAIKIGLLGMESLPGMAMSAPIGAVAGIGLRVAAASLASRGIGGTAMQYAAGAASPLTRGGKIAGALPQTLGASIGEGVQAGAQSAGAVKSEIQSTPFEKLADMPGFREIHESLGGGDESLSVARDIFADAMADYTFERTVPATAGLGALAGGGVLGQMFARRAGKIDHAGLFKRTISGGTGEFAQESLQSGSDKLIENLRTQEFVDPNQETWAGVPRAAIEGGLVGAHVGATFGALDFNSGKANQGRTAPPAAPGQSGTPSAGGPSASDILDMERGEQAQRDIGTSQGTDEAIDKFIQAANAVSPAESTVGTQDDVINQTSGVDLNSGVRRNDVEFAFNNYDTELSGYHAPDGTPLTRGQYADAVSDANFFAEEQADITNRRAAAQPALNQSAISGQQETQGFTSPARPVTRSNIAPAPLSETNQVRIDRAESTQGFSRPGDGTQNLDLELVRTKNGGYAVTGDLTEENVSRIVDAAKYHGVGVRANLGNNDEIESIALSSVTPEAITGLSRMVPNLYVTKEGDANGRIARTGRVPALDEAGDTQRGANVQRGAGHGMLDADVAGRGLLGTATSTPESRSEPVEPAGNGVQPQAALSDQSNNIDNQTRNLDAKRAAYALQIENGAPDDVAGRYVMGYQEKTNEHGEAMNLWLADTGTIGLVPASQPSPFAVGSRVVATFHPETTVTQAEQSAYDRTFKTEKAANTYIKANKLKDVMVMPEGSGFRIAARQNRNVTRSNNLLQRIRQLGGINIAERSDIQRDKVGSVGVFTKNGMGIDDLASMLQAEGFPVVGTKTGNLAGLETDGVDGGVDSLRELVERAINGETILNHDGQQAALEAENKAQYRDNLKEDIERMGGTFARNASTEKLEAIRDKLRADMSQNERTKAERLEMSFNSVLTDAEWAILMDEADANIALDEVDAFIANQRAEELEITNAIEQRYREEDEGNAGRAPARETRQDSATGGDQPGTETAQGRGREEERFSLTGQTEEEIRADERARIEKEQEDARREKADDMRGDFLLTGSDREADQAAAHGQQDIFADAPSAQTVTAPPQGEASNTKKPIQQGDQSPATQPDNVPQEGKAGETTQADEAPKSALDAHDALFERAASGELTAEELKAAFERTVANEAGIKAELSAMTKDAIFKRLPGLVYRYKNEKKDRLIEGVYLAMMDMFVLGDSISYSHGDKYEDVIRGYVDRTTDDDIQIYADKVKKARTERAERLQAMQEGINNPKTIDDFKRLMYVKAKSMPDGVTFRDVFLELTPEQREQFDALAAEESRGRRQATIDRQKTEIRVAAHTTEGQIIETKHTRTGEPLFVVKSAERVDRDIYNQWNATAKRLGGGYSSYRGGGAVPGFQFKTRENAEAFLQYLGGNTDQAKSVVQERRDSFADDRSQSASERLAEMADALEERADASLSVERKANTARRARMAASAEASANSDKAMAQTMRNIANAIKDGTAKFLDLVRQKVQIETLQGFVSSAHYDLLRKKYPGYADYERHKGEKPTREVADYVEFPNYTAYRSDLANLGRALSEIDNFKKLGQRILSVADDVSDAYLAFAKENLHKVTSFTKSDGSLATFKSKADAETAIARSGYKGTAIVLPFKRGENLIVLSPSEAIKRGIWQGDNDKRITLSGDLGAELVEKLGRANRTNRNMPDVPWQFVSAYDKRKRLSAMGIESPAELSSAIREFISLREAPKQADKVKEMERAMIGRSNDGLDFFPTPASVAEQMVETADIQEGMAVLEPSAGMGHIAERIREAGIDPDVVEMSGDRRDLLEAKGFSLVGNDFMDVSGKYDRIIMNPPFSNRRDAEHVMHAYTLLKPGGRIVAIMGEGVFFGTDKKAQEFRDWLEQVGGTEEKLEEGTFLDPSLPVNTGVNARLVVIDKPENSEVARFSKSDKPLNAHTKSTLRTALDKIMGTSWVERLLNTGKFRIVTEDEARLVIGEGALFSQSDVTQFMPRGSVGKAMAVDAGINGSGTGEVWLMADGSLMIDGIRAYPGDVLFKIPDDKLGTRFVKRESITQEMQDEIANDYKTRIDQLVYESENINRKVAKKSPRLAKPIIPDGIDDGSMLADLFADYGENDWKTNRYPKATNTSLLNNYERTDAISAKHDPDAIRNYVVWHEVISNTAFTVGGYLHVPEDQEVTGAYYTAMHAYWDNGGKLGRTAIEAAEKYAKEHKDVLFSKYNRPLAFFNPDMPSTIEGYTVTDGVGKFGKRTWLVKHNGELVGEYPTHIAKNNVLNIHFDEIDAAEKKKAKRIQAAKLGAETRRTIAALKDVMLSRRSLIENAHKNQILTFHPMRLEDFRASGTIPLHRSGGYGKRAGSAYRLVMVDGRPAYARESDHWGVFHTSDWVNGEQVSKEHDWALEGVGQTQFGATKRHAGYVFLDDLEPPKTKSATGNIGTFDGTNPDIRYSKDNRPLAFFNPADGMTYLIADNIDQSHNLEGLLRHEIGVHALHMGRDSKEFEGILSDLRMMRKAGNALVMEAYTKAKEAEASDAVLDEESLGYLVEHHPGVGIVRRFMAWFKAQVQKLTGFQMKLTPDDLVAMAQSALRGAPEGLSGENRMADGAGQTVGAMFSRATPHKQMNHDPDAEEAGLVEASVEGKSAIDAARWMTANAPQEYRAIADKVLKRLQMLQAAGVKLTFRVAHVGDSVPRALIGARGMVDYRFGKENAGMDIWVNGADVTGKVGTSYETVMHELVHAATLAATRIGSRGVSEGTKVRQDVADLVSVTNAITKHINQRIADYKAGNAELSEFESDIAYGRINAFRDIDEVLSWALTNKDAQAYLEAIPYKGKSLWTAFVQAIRSALSLDAKADTALSEVLRISEALMDDNINELIPLANLSGQSLMTQQASDAVVRTFDVAESGKRDDWIYELQDKHIDLKRIIDGIRESGGTVDDKWNAYMQEALYHGRAADRTEQFLNDEMQPLLKHMKASGLSMEDLNNYLWARHAKERNEVMAELNPDMDDNQGLSGMTDEKASAVLRELSGVSGIREAAAMVDGMIAKTREMMVEYGLEKRETVDGWASMYQSYVPLMREGFDQMTGIGQGFSVRGSSSKHATGSHRAVEEILAHVAMQREKIITRGEKNRVGLSMLGLAMQNPNKGIWKIDKPAMVEYVNPDTGLTEAVPGDMADYGVPRKRTLVTITEYVVSVDGEAEATFKNQRDAKEYAKTLPGSTVEKMVRQEAKSIPDPMYESRPNVLGVRVNGEDRAIIFKEDNPRAMRLAESMKNLDMGELGLVTGAVGKVTRYIASVNTQYNPVFGIVNLVRDTQTAMLNLSSTPLHGKQAEVTKETMKALKGIYSDARAIRKGRHPSSDYAALWEEFKRYGGQTGYRDMFKTGKERAEAIQHMLDPEWWQKTKLGKFATAGGLLAKPEQFMLDAKYGGKRLFHWLSDYNLTMENAVRLAAYKVGTENGMSKESAAHLAKTLTVNFNKKGARTTQLGAWYAFFNASVQGTARIAETLTAGAKPGEWLGPVGKKIVLGGISIGAAQAVMLALAGFDEDEPREFVRERALVIPAPGTDKGYVTIPMPLGFHILPNIGRKVMETVMYGKPLDHLGELMLTIFEGLNPVGGGASVMQMVAPTIADPVAALSENKDWTGKAIYREAFSQNDPSPGFDRAKDSATPWARSIAYALNWITGGTDYVKGGFSPTPDQIDYLLGQATGGVGREVGKAFQSVDAVVNDEDLPTYKIPLVGRFVGSASGGAAIRDQFYDNIRLMNEHEAEIRGRKENSEPTGQYLLDNPEARLAKESNSLEYAIRELGKQRKAAIAAGKDDQAKLLAERIKAKMERFNEQVEALQR